MGEPLNPEAVWWGKEVLGLPIHDNWWQTETGGIMIANVPALDIKPGSMGKPLPGVEAGSCAERPQASPGARDRRPRRRGRTGAAHGLAVDVSRLPEQEERYRKCFSGDLYLTGDLARRDADGYFWFVGRADDVIKSAGHLIGPFEVESALMEHPAVAEAGVIGKPDPMAGEIVKAFVSLKPGFEPARRCAWSCSGHARKRLGAAVAPKEIAFLPTCRAPAAARSCAACSRRANWVCPRATPRRWRPGMKPLRPRTVADDRRNVPAPSGPCPSSARRRTRGALPDMLRIRRWRRSAPSSMARAKIRGFLPTSARKRSRPA